MQVTATNSNTASTLGADTSSDASRIPAKTLTQDDFIKLLITQMTSQDPLNPQSNTDFAAQMAQFTALEQSRTISSTLSNMQGEQQALQANGMIGRTVMLDTGHQTSVSGTVDGVQMDSGTARIVVNGVAYDLSQVLAISPTPVKP
jgi:flagellar basal-body rod modification protein FlgD